MLGKHMLHWRPDTPSLQEHCPVLLSQTSSNAAPLAVGQAQAGGGGGGEGGSREEGEDKLLESSLAQQKVQLETPQSCYGTRVYR